MPSSFQARFAITHYFNPVRYMRLLELVRGEQTDEAIIETLQILMTAFLARVLYLVMTLPDFGKSCWRICLAGWSGTSGKT